MKNLFKQIIILELAIGQSVFANTANQNIINAHSCTVTSKKTNIKVQAICGKKLDPKYGEVLSYRTFTAPNGEIYQEWQLENGNIHTEKTVSQSIINKVEIERPVYQRRHTVVERSESDKAWTTGQKVLAIGAGIVAIAGVGFIGHAIYKSGKKASESERQQQDEAFQRGYQQAVANKPKALKNMPSQIKLGTDVPNSNGQTVAVAGAVPSSSVPANVPRFSTSSGQQYIVQQNPSTNLLETILIYDMLTHPYWFPGAFPYSVYNYSPFYYGGGGAVLVHDNYISDGGLSYSNVDLSVPTERVSVTAETFNREEVVSDTVETPKQDEYTGGGGGSDIFDNGAGNDSGGDFSGGGSDSF